jgi:hypothetical protein
MRKDLMQMSNAQAVIGKNDWLFLCNDSNRVVEQNQGTLLLSSEDVTRWIHVLEARITTLRAMGMHYYFLVAPNKECLYPEYLPDNYKLSDNRIIRQLINAGKFAGLELHYPLDILKAYKNEYLLYPTGNTHWNGSGAFIAYRYMMNELNQDFNIPILDWSDIYFEDEDITQDLGNKLIPPRSAIFTWGKVKNPQAQVIYDNGVLNSGKTQITHNKNRSLPTGVIFHDSFMEMMLPFLMESFGMLYLFHTPCVDYTIIEKIKPDIVISEMVERFLLQIPNN